jgi:hypothetical protein
MEQDYQRDLLSSTLDRLRPMWFFVVPLCWLWKILLFLSHFIFNQPWPGFEFVISFVKVTLLFFFTGLCCVPWRKELQGRIGLILVWLNRVFVLILLLHEAIPQSASETQIMFLLVLEMMLGAVITPTFCEYMLFSVTFALIKPVSTHLLGLDSSSIAISSDHIPDASLQPPSEEISRAGQQDPLPQALAQHAILLFISAGVNFRIHCDRRRIWLLSVNASRQQSGRRRIPRTRSSDPPAPAADAPAPADNADDGDDAGAEDEVWAGGDFLPDGGPPGDGEPPRDPADWDALAGDGYYTAAERAELAPVVQAERREIRRRAAEVLAPGGGGAELRWHHAKDIVGAGSFGYVYQASA